MVHRIFILCILLPLIALQAKPEATRLELYYGIAEGNYLIGNLEGAAKAVEQMLKLDPDYVLALTLNARVLVDQNKPQQALQAVERAVALEPDNLEHQLLKALVLGNMDRRDEAIDTITQIQRSASAESKHHRVASKLYGLLLMAEGDWNTAAEIFNQAYLDNPETAKGNLALASEAYLQQAQSALKQRDFDAAIEAVDQALVLAENYSGEAGFEQRARLNMFRIQILTRAGQIDSAIKSLQDIIGQQPDNLEALVTLASLYASAEQWESLQDILAPIGAEPELQDIALYLQGRVALASGRAGAARETFETALRLLPDGPGKLRASLEFYQGACFLEVNRVAEGDTKIIQSLDSGFRPETEEEAILASRSLLRAQQSQRAVTLLEAVTLNDIIKSAEAWNLLGRAHLANDSTALALSAFNQSLSIQPDQPETLALRGSLLRKIGDLEGAATDIQNALQIDPENAALTYSLGLIRLQLGNLETAEQLIGQSAGQLSENMGIHLLHALLAYNIGNHETARSALETYLKRVPEKTNESAFYLEYLLTAQEDSRLAIDRLNQRAQSPNTTHLLSNFLAYVHGTLDRKAVLDAAGHSETREIARQQLCEAAYWLAQHERVHEHTEKAVELLKLAIQIGSTDYPEYQFAQWQLKI